ncbi:uncharacterized protein B0J16DRAFT_416167 [Fusarium flagelliforme]|uniref:uncharacterized protein n=1 Tax=Fusarium flagelliforme TaxID=2675880 RepID=UPI001E8D5F50|nr:uncharacterized protein B0J16DRAFT_416167 [Fusarium flagelliforme]KAH7183028.1 hypothetical protein B0J16DRAFT_416167 [Fusarium flagelliforme]
MIQERHILSFKQRMHRILYLGIRHWIDFMTHRGWSSTDLLPFLLVPTASYTCIFSASNPKEKVRSIQGGFQEGRKRKL